jgi:predicted RNase H-like HicB family nuclease
MRYPIILHTDDNQQFGVTVPDLPGCFSHGDSVENAVDNAREAILFHAKGLIADKHTIPPPTEFIDLSDFHGDVGTAFIAYAEVDIEVIRGPARAVKSR